MENFPESTLVAVDGRMVSAATERFAMALNELSSELELQWIPPEQYAEQGEARFRIVHNPPNGLPYVIFTVKREEDLNARLLQKILMNDQARRGQVTMSELEAWDEANARLQREAYLDRMEELHDIAFHILRTRKNTYKVNDDLVIKSGIPFNAARLKDR